MIQVKVFGLVVDGSEQPVILLQAIGDPARAEKVMPVWIGPQEATSILVAVQHASVGRPLSHDLMAKLLSATDSRIENVTIPRITDGTFYAEIELVTPNGTEILDARPSDAIALASRVDAPIWVAEDVYDDVSVEAELEQEPADKEEQEEQIAQFRDFVEHVDPEAFKRWTD